MPLLKIFHPTTDSQIGIWKISESTSELSAMLPHEILNDDLFSLISAPSRRKEFLAVRCLLQKMTDSSLRIAYYNRKPILVNDNRRISISHSKDFATIALLPEHNTSAIDIECFSGRALRIAEKFLSCSELQFIQSSSNPDFFATLFWSIKESVFKSMDDGCYDFRSHITIHTDTFPSSLNGTCTASESCSHNKTLFHVQYWKSHHFILTFASPL